MFLWVKKFFFFLVLALGFAAFVGYLIWLNMSWVVQNQGFLYVYDRVGAGLNTFVPVTIRSSLGPLAISPRDKNHLTQGAVTVLTASEAVTMAAKRDYHRPRGILIIANTPGDFANLSYPMGSQLLLQATLAAVQLNATIMIDCSSADLARLSNQGQNSLALMKKHKIIRGVIFDGGHHLPALALNPDIIIAPIFPQRRGENIIAHGYVKDAIPLDQVLNLCHQLGLTSTVATVPRWPTVAKTKTAMAKLIIKAILNHNDNTIKSPSIRVNPLVSQGSRPVVVLEHTALAAIPPRKEDLQKTWEIIKKSKARNLYLALLYPEKNTYKDDVNSFLELAASQEVQIHIVTQPYNAMDLMGFYLIPNINLTINSHTNNGY
ncbi:MAG: hypothetical protein ACYDG6_05750 [Thermincolia bacterium]